MITPRTRHAFTLIELLVVITVLGLLFALLLPVFLTARERSRQSACAANLRHIGLALQMYSSDNDSILPTQFSALDSYRSNHTLYLCPDGDQALATDYQYRIGSLLSVDPDQPKQTPGKMLHPEPFTVLAFCDSHIRNKFFPTQNPGEFIVLRADGSVSRVHAEQTVQWSYYDGRWFPPSSPPTLNSSIWNVFPGEPWPPSFEK
jgi:prepilin-type N-terminal cleavage/methylation domain-containing protein